MTTTPARHSLLLVLAATSLAGCRPPAAELHEAYSPGNEGAASFDHSLLDQTLKRFVDASGRVDYAGLGTDRGDLDRYLAKLAKADFEALGRDGKLALLINAYNAFTLALILDHPQVASIRDIPEAERWKAERWQIGTLRLSLDQIEHEYLRPKFREPRIHFAVNCASIGCPPLRREAYRAADIETQLQDQAVRMHNDPTWLKLDVAARSLRLTPLYDWFAGDFEQVAGTVVDYAARFHQGLAQMLAAGTRPEVRFLDYDWRVNRQ